MAAMPQFGKNNALFPLPTTEGLFFRFEQIALPRLLLLPSPVCLDVSPRECRHPREDISDLNQWFDLRLRRNNLNDPEVFLEPNSESQAVGISSKAALRRCSI